MIKLDKVRLVIWDMDETFWKGTLSEGEVSIPEENKEIIKELSRRGIVNSISSKNNDDELKKVLEKEEMWEYFVFPRINWDSKGKQVKWIIDSIRLRPATVMFIDDNTTNLQEVLFYNPDIQVSDPSIISGILSNPLFDGKNDINLSRLKQYKVLERKAEDETKAGSNEEFLASSNIKVEIIENNLVEVADRITELIQRTNQLNFTKKRLEKEEVLNLINNSEYRTGYVKVRDKYGDYGIVGFFAIKNDCLEHFCFSCRTIGIGVEQWVYYKLGSPQLNVVGDVVTKIVKNQCPDWINNNSDGIESITHTSTESVLLLGGCDLEQTAYYLSQTDLNFVSKFNHVIDNRFDCHPESTELLRQSKELSIEQQQHLIDLCPFYDDMVFANGLFDQMYDFVFYSPMIDLSLGQYRELSSGLKVVYGNCDFPHLVGHSYLSDDEFKKFTETFCFEGRITEERFLDNLIWIRKELPNETKLIMINFSEINISHPQEPNRYLVHREFNKIIDRFCDMYDNVDLLDIRKMVTKEADHTDNIRHYSREIYHKIAKEVLNYIEKDNGDKKYSLENVNGLSISFRKLFKRLLRKIGLLSLAYKVNSFVYDKFKK